LVAEEAGKDSRRGGGSSGLGRAAGALCWAGEAHLKRVLARVLRGLGGTRTLAQRGSPGCGGGGVDLRLPGSSTVGYGGPRPSSLHRWQPRCCSPRLHAGHPEPHRGGRLNACCTIPVPPPLRPLPARCSRTSNGGTPGWATRQKPWAGSGPRPRGRVAGRSVLGRNCAPRPGSKVFCTPERVSACPSWYYLGARRCSRSRLVQRPAIGHGEKEKKTFITERTAGGASVPVIARLGRPKTAGRRCLSIGRSDVRASSVGWNEPERRRPRPKGPSLVRGGAGVAGRGGPQGGPRGGSRPEPGVSWREAKRLLGFKIRLQARRLRLGSTPRSRLSLAETALHGNKGAPAWGSCPRSAAGPLGGQAPHRLGFPGASPATCGRTAGGWIRVGRGSGAAGEGV